MKEVYIWGTGYEAEKCVSNINLENCIIKGFIETKPDKILWKDKNVYAGDDLLQLKYDYIIIANIYYGQIIETVRKKELADEDKIIDWMKLSTNIYYYSEEIWGLFSDDYLKNNFYILNTNVQKGWAHLPERLYKYKRIFIYDLRLENKELDVGLFIGEILNNLKDDAGMAFIPNEKLIDEIWYHNLLYVLDREAIVIWDDLNSAYASYMINNPEKFSYRRFHCLQFERKQIRTVPKGRYMLFGTKLIYEEKRRLIEGAEHIKVYNLRCDRIGEEIRMLNRLLFEDDEEGIFKLYIPIDAYYRPFEGTNACFNELVSRRINLLNNKNEYALWIQDIFHRSEHYEYDRGWIELRHLNSGMRKPYLPIIDFANDELVVGRRLISDRFGLQENYVCLFTRDSEYLKKTLPDIDCSYHNYRDSSFDIMNSAIDYFDDCDIQTIRMGQITEKREIYPKCIDFANHGYDEALDLFIFRYSKFSICSCSGILEIPNTFGRPVLFLFYYYPPVGQFNLFYAENDLFIFNRIYDLNKKRELLMSEIFDVAFEIVSTGHCRSEYLEQCGLELIPFSQDDILCAAVEMNEKLDGTWQCGNRDEELKNKFDFMLKDFFDKHSINVSRIPLLPISVAFLHKYEYLLDG